jgi:hypothetical protein
MTQTVTLKDVRTEQVTELQGAIDDTTAKAKQAADRQAVADQNVNADQAELVKLKAEASVLQQEFATATMEADQHEIERQLHDNKVNQRDAQIKLDADQDELAGLTQQSQSLAGRITALQAALAQANADLNSAQQQDAAAADDRTALNTSVTGAVQEAGSAEVTAQVTEASDKLASLVGGANMVEVLRARYDHAQAIIGDKQRAVARAQLATVAVTKLTSPSAAAAATAAAQYAAAAQSANRWATGGPGRLGAARQALQQTIGIAAFSSAVTTDVSGKATAATDSGAAAADKAFHEAAVASIAADADLNDVTGPKAAADPNYNPANDDTVKAQRDAAAAADQALTAADAARTPKSKQTMTDWDLSLPPDAFTLAIATFDAQSQITELAGLDVTALLATLDAAETAYAGALRDQAAISTLQQAAAVNQASRQADATQYAAGADQRLLAVVRGDL